MSLNSYEIRITRGLHFSFKDSHVHGSVYETSIIIHFLNKEYLGDYRLVIKDASDEDNKAEMRFKIEGKLSEGKLIVLVAI